MNTLVQLHYSPWSERARWALEFHGVPYRAIEHVPLAGEIWLRLKARKFTGKLSVPLLLTDDNTVITDSLRIAQHAERVSTRKDGARLFPPEKTAELMRWHELAEAMCQAGRALLTRRMAYDPQALAEALPPFVPDMVRPKLVPIAAMGTAFVRFKYGVGARDEARDDEVLREGVKECMAGLEGREYLLGAFSYADIAVATALQFVSPVDDRHLFLGRATRECWTYGHLADESVPLLEWRDRVYAANR